MHLIRTNPAATFHLDKWYSIKLCFLFNVDFNLELLSTTLLLSFKILDSLSMGIPNILNLNFNPMICSTHVFNAINSLPKVIYSTVACLLIYQIIGARLTNTIYHVCNRLVFLSDSRDASKNAVTSTALPLYFVASIWSSSLAPLYLSQNASVVLPLNNVGSITAGLGS